VAAHGGVPACGNARDALERARGRTEKQRFLAVTRAREAARGTACAHTRRLGLPLRRGGGLCASKTSHAQAAYESANTLQYGVLAGVNFMMHAAGWLESGLAMGYEKSVLYADRAGMLSEYEAPAIDPAVDEALIDYIARRKRARIGTD
jgi:trimethylamine:corrinoid methyltransferase-like protein